MNGKLGHANAREPEIRQAGRFAFRRLIVDPCGAAMSQRQPQSAEHIRADRDAERLERSRRAEIIRGGDVKRQECDLGCELKPAGDLPVEFAVGCVEIGAACDRLPVPQRRVAIKGCRPDQNDGRSRREIIGEELLEQIIGELGKFVLEFELHARRKQGRAFEEARDHRIDAVADESPQPFGDARILFGEFTRLLVKQLELTVIMIEKFLVHDYAGLSKILPLSISTSAMNSTGTLTGWHMSSARTTKRILSSALSSPVSRETSI